MNNLTPILYHYEKKTKRFSRKMSYQHYPSDGTYTFVEDPCHIEKCILSLCNMFTTIIMRDYFYPYDSSGNGLLWNSPFYVWFEQNTTFDDISLLIIKSKSKIYEKMSIVEAFIHLLLYVETNFETICPKSTSFVETWITMEQYGLLKRKILLFLYELDRIELPCICKLRRKTIMDVLRRVYLRFIQREHDNDQCYHSIFTYEPLQKISCFDIRQYIHQYVRTPSSDGQVHLENKKENIYLSLYDRRQYRTLSFHSSFEDSMEYESLREDEDDLFQKYNWTTTDCFLYSHKETLSKLFPKRKNIFSLKTK